MKREEQKCQCCRNVLPLMPADSFEFYTCMTCGWEQDTVAEWYPEAIVSSNPVTLSEARTNFYRFGVCNPTGSIKSKREPRESSEEE